MAIQRQLGAKTYTTGDLLLIEGGGKLSGARTIAIDLRAEHTEF